MKSHVEEILDLVRSQQKVLSMLLQPSSKVKQAQTLEKLYEAKLHSKQVSEKFEILEESILILYDDLEIKKAIKPESDLWTSVGESLASLKNEIFRLSVMLTM